MSNTSLPRVPAPTSPVPIDSAPTGVAPTASAPTAGRIAPSARTVTYMLLAVLAVLNLFFVHGHRRVALLVVLGAVATLVSFLWNGEPSEAKDSRAPGNYLHPTPRAWRFTLIGMVFATLPAVLGATWVPLWLFALLLVLALLLVDTWRVVSGATAAPTMQAPTTQFVGDERSVRFDFAGGIHPGARETVLWLQTTEHIEAPSETSVSSNDTSVSLPLKAKRRGRGEISRLWIRATGPLGLMALDRVIDLSADVTVTPDVRPVQQSALRFFDPRSSRSGIKIERFLGDGSEFDAMREYVPGFDSRSISWRSTARHRRLICHEFRAERNHDVVIAWDTGRLMSELMESGTRLDAAISAGLVLAHAAIHTGDRVGAYAFGARPGVFVAPNGSRQAFAHLLQVAGGLEYGQTETNFTLGLTALAQRLRRRTLVVMLTDFVDTVTAELMIENMSHLLRRHVVVFVSVQDPALQEIALAPPRRRKDLLEAFVASEQARDRQAVLLRLSRRGAHCLDAPAKQIGAALLNRYLDIRRRELV